MDLNNIIAYVYCGIALLCAFVLIVNARIVSLITSKYTIKRYVFYAFLFAGLASIFDCVYILRERNVVNFSQASNYILTIIYVILSTLTGVFWVSYSEKKQNSWFAETKRRFNLYCLPLVVSILIILSTPLTHWYFYFENGYYERGPLFIIASVPLLLYSFQTGIFALIKSFKKEYYIDRNEYRRLFSFTIVYFLTQVIQLILPPVFPYRSVGLMLVYYVFLLQNMKEMIEDDALTHISNRFASERMLDTIIISKEKAEVVMIDVDKFKSINDTYGHQEGDKALQLVSSVLTLSVEKTCFVGRMGGDEFILINSDLNHSLIDIEDKVNSKLASLLKEANSEYRFTISAGYALKDDTINSIPDLIKLADDKLYERKKEKHKMLH